MKPTLSVCSINISRNRKAYLPKKESWKVKPPLCVKSAVMQSSLQTSLERYGDISELTPEILNMLVDKIMVYEPRAVDGVMRQQIDVYYRYIGVVKLVDYGSTTYYKSGEVLTAAKKRENAKMEKRIAAVKEEMQSDEAVSA